MAETHQPRILVVDDTQATRYMVSRALAKEGFEVDEAANVRECEQFLQEHHPDLIVLDVQLPDGDGLALGAKIKSNPDTAMIPILHVSATHISGEAQARGLENGADAYLIHPVDPLVLVATVNVLLKMAATERSLMEVGRRFQSLAEAIPQIVFITDPQGRVEYYNKRWYDYTGREPGPLRPFETAIHPEDVVKAKYEFSRVFLEKRAFEIELRLLRFDGEFRWHLIRTVPSHETDGGAIKYFGTATDIDDHVRTKHRNEETLTKLNAERTMREQFVATLTHDLRNPLAAAKISAQILARNKVEPTRQPALIGRIIDSLDRADQMITNLLDANRIKAGERLPLEIEELSLYSILRETLDELSSVHGNRFVLNCDTNLAGFWSQSALRRIIENLASNAVKYGDAHAPIVVSVRTESHFAKLCVQNQGPTLSEEEQAKLFEPFHRGKDSKLRGNKGWGLGLTLVRGLTEAHGGHIEVKSTSHLGTVFTVTLPRDCRQQSSVEERSA